jgi:hypothetical protein
MPKTADWRSPETADVVKDLDRSALAWEFLRRNPEFRQHYTSVLERIGSKAVSEEDALAELCHRWGCLTLRDPRLADSGPILWCPELVAVGVTLVAAPERFSKAHELSVSDVDDACADLQCADGRQVVLRDPDGDHRFWLRNIGIGDRLAGLVVLDDKFALRVAALRRLQRRLAGRSPGPLPRAWQLTRRHRRRLILMLRAFDGHLACASYREIADALFGAEAVTRYVWKTSSIRAQTIRLVKDAIRMTKGGYRRLLSGD